MLLQTVTLHLYLPLQKSADQRFECSHVREAWSRGWSQLLPALAVGQRRLLLPRDEGGPPDRAAVAVPEPAHGRRRRVLRGAEAMVRLGFSCQG